jgi:adenine-specific DNA-methyltransferase
MHLDDIEHESAPKVEQYLSQIKVIRSIAHKIIQFLEQLENFQKKLWLKKKFVIETNYCITLDRVPEEFYPEIAKNDDQREEWVRLFAIDEIKKDLNQPGYSKPLKIEFLRGQPHLVLDTRHFTKSFVASLLGSIANIDNDLNGIAIHSDNFQALSLTSPRLKDSVRTTYIDPPYNTGSDGFVYKDGYQQSTWLSMMSDRIRIAKYLLQDGGAFISSIDEFQAAMLKTLLVDSFSIGGAVADIVWQKRYAPDIRTAISDAHEYIFVFSNNSDEFKRTRNKLPLTDAQTKQFSNPDNDPRGPWKADNFTAQGYRPNQMYEITTPSGRVVRPPSGRCWVVTKENYEQLTADARMYFAKDGDGQPAVKRFLKDMDGMVPWTWWNHEDAGHSQGGMKETMAIFGRGDGFVTAKPLKLITRLLTITSQSTSLILDYFAGSGTTAHAVIEMNRESNSKRKYAVVEMATYFDDILLTRIKKAVYSNEWNEGKPTSRKGTSHFCKYIRLESYEDALNNLELKRSQQQGMLLDADAEMREQYILSYMLDVESRGSQSLLNVEAFRNPDEYKLRVERNGETQLVNVDLVETFNWLLGLTVKHIDVIRSVRVVEGKAPNGDRVLVLWRNIDQMDNDALDKWFEKQDYNTREMVYDVFYVNGDNNLENLRRLDQTWKVRLIEEEFKRLMFDVEDV